MTSAVEKACAVVTEGKVTRAHDAHVYDVMGSKGNTYQVILRETDSGRIPICDCAAGREGMDCYHGLAALWQDTRASAREQAWDGSIAALRCLTEIVDAEGTSEVVRAALFGALDRFDEAHNIETANAENTNAQED
jgi:hypothetical protein